MLLDPNPNAEIDVDVSLYIPTAEDAVQSSEFSQPIVGSSAEFLTELIDDVQNSRSAVLRQETNDEADTSRPAFPDAHPLEMAERADPRALIQTELTAMMGMLPITMDAQIRALIYSLSCSFTCPVPPCPLVAQDKTIP